MINFYKGYIDCAPTNASGNVSHVAGKFSFKIHVAESHIFEELGWGGAWITVMDEMLYEMGGEGTTELWNLREVLWKA